MAKRAKKPAKRAGKKAGGSRAKTKKGKPARKARNFAELNGKFIGFVVAPNKTDWNKYADAFADKLARLGWSVNHDDDHLPRVDIIYQPTKGAAGDATKIRECAQRFVDDEVDVIVTSGTEATKACMSKTNRIPIVFAAAGDPVNSGLVGSIAQPGGNVTGCSNLQTNGTALTKRVTVMAQKLNPGNKAVGVIGNDSVDVVHEAIGLTWEAIHAYDNTITLTPKDSGRFAVTDFANRAAIKAKLDALVATVAPTQVKILYMCSDPLLTSKLDLINDVAKRDFTPPLKTMHEIKERHGGDQSLGPSFKTLFEKAAEKVNLILRGDNPGDIEVYVPYPNRMEVDPA